MSNKRQFDVLVIGGGNAGISAAARLINKGITNVAVLEPNSVHTYRPLLSWVGGGQASLNSAQRTQRSVTPKGCTWLEDSAVDIDPDARVVRCASGRSYGYRDLVLGTGLVPDHDELSGIYEALDTPYVCSNYLDRAEETWEQVQALPLGGHAVFTVPRPPVSCTGTTLKPLFLAAAYWKKERREAEITLVIDRPVVLGVPDLDLRLLKYLRELGVRILRGTAVTGLDPATRHITVTDQDGAASPLHYDLLHLVPPYRGQPWLTASGLTGEHGLVDIDAHTFQHRHHGDVWAAGDGAAVDTDPSGGGLRQQVSILVDNLIGAREGKELASYDGYTVAPIAVDTHKLVAAEFDRTGAITSAIPSFLDPLKPRRTAWAFDRYGLPFVYWNFLLRGHL